MSAWKDAEHDDVFEAYQQWLEKNGSFDSTNFEVFVGGVEWCKRKEKINKRQVLNPLGFSRWDSGD
jgi:hypothetical protein